MCCLNVLPMFCPSVLPSVLPIVVHSGIEDGEATTVGSPTEGSPGLPGGRRTRVHDDGATCSQLVVGRGFIVAATTTRRRRGDDDDDHDEAATTSALTQSPQPQMPSQSMQPPRQSLQPPRPQSLWAHGPCSPPGPHSRCSPQAVAAALTEAQNLSASQVPSRCSSPGSHPHTGLPLTDPRGW